MDVVQKSCRSLSWHGARLRPASARTRGSPLPARLTNRAGTGEAGRGALGALNRYPRSRVCRHARKWRAVTVEVLAKLDPGRRLGEQFLKLDFALLKRSGPPILAVELQKVEGVEERLIVIGPAMRCVGPIPSQRAIPSRKASQDRARPSRRVQQLFGL
jgi:hypothetical protein